ncbi:MAG: phosphoglycerate kinase [Bacteroides stercoris]
MTIDQFNFAGKKAFVRVDFNVPLDENFNITDDTRMRAALPTLKKILADGGSIIIGSHTRSSERCNRQVLFEAHPETFVRTAGC